MFKQLFLMCLLIAGLSGVICFSIPSTPIVPDTDPSPPLTPTEELASFQIEPGLKIQLVASEPMVQDPVVTTFDENGRLWVVEMRGFMQNIDGSGEKERVGRIS